jgi:hyperosmotically inducible protein
MGMCRSAAALVLVLVGALSLHVSAQTPRQRALDRVAEAILRYPRYTVFDYVDADYERGVLTIWGKVTMPFKRTDLERLVVRIEGVERVVNELDVLPVSQLDDRLRQDISRAIYGNPSFWQYASMPNPPIHIIVERGQVTLMGVVQSEVERQLARSLATSFGAFSITNELITERERRRMPPPR